MKKITIKLVKDTIGDITGEGEEEKSGKREI